MPTYEREAGSAPRPFELGGASFLHDPMNATGHGRPPQSKIVLGTP